MPRKRGKSNSVSESPEKPTRRSNRATRTKNKSPSPDWDNSDDDEIITPSKRRGPKMDVDYDESGEDSTEEVVQPVSKKRGRGRPPAAAVSEAPEAGRKTRLRRPRAGAELTHIAEDEEQEEPAPARRTRRGRKPKGLDLEDKSSELGSAEDEGLRRIPGRAPNMSPIATKLSRTPSGGWLVSASTTEPEEEEEEDDAPKKPVTAVVTTDEPTGSQTKPTVTEQAVSLVKPKVNEPAVSPVKPTLSEPSVSPVKPTVSEPVISPVKAAVSEKVVSPVKTQVIEPTVSPLKPKEQTVSPVKATEERISPVKSTSTVQIAALIKSKTTLQVSPKKVEETAVKTSPLKPAKAVVQKEESSSSSSSTSSTSSSSDESDSDEQENSAASTPQPQEIIPQPKPVEEKPVVKQIEEAVPTEEIDPNIAAITKIDKPQEEKIIPTSYKSDKLSSVSHCNVLEIESAVSSIITDLELEATNSPAIVVMKVDDEDQERKTPITPDVIRNIETPKPETPEVPETATEKIPDTPKVIEEKPKPTEKEVTPEKTTVQEKTETPEKVTSVVAEEKVSEEPASEAKETTPDVETAPVVFIEDKFLEKKMSDDEDESGDEIIMKRQSEEARREQAKEESRARSSRDDSRRRRDDHDRTDRNRDSRRRDRSPIRTDRDKERSKEDQKSKDRSRRSVERKDDKSAERKRFGRASSPRSKGTEKASSPKPKVIKRAEKVTLKRNRLESSETKENIISVEEEIVTDTTTAPSKKRRWGKSNVPKTTSKAPVVAISTDVLKNLIPDAKLVPEEEVTKLLLEDEEETVTDSDKKHRRESRGAEALELLHHSDDESNSPVHETVTVIMPADLPTDEIIEGGEDELPVRGRTVRKVITQDDDVLQKTPSPPRHAPTSILHITNLVRPFTVLQLKELLNRTGTIIEDNFWIDKIKSRCMVEYSSEEEARSTRHALHGVKWPITNPKRLNVDFTTYETLVKYRNKDESSGGGISQKESKSEKEETRNGTLNRGDLRREIEREKSKRAQSDERASSRRTKIEAPVREWDLHKLHQSDSDDKYAYDRDRKGRKRSSHSLSPARKTKKKSDEVKLLDDLFNKTKTMPHLYWLPLTPQQIAEKEELRRKHMMEFSRRMSEYKKDDDRGGGGGGRMRPPIRRKSFDRRRSRKSNSRTRKSRSNSPKN